MWNLFNCYLSGRHEFGVWCEPGSIFLRCVHCGKRSTGWSVNAAARAEATQPQSQAPAHSAQATAFDRALAR
jgi:hypothetical protein